MLARSGLELLILFERDRCRLLGRAVALDKVAYCIGISMVCEPATHIERQIEMSHRKKPAAT